MSSIVDRIKDLIQEEGLTNKEFAQKLELNPSIISHILSGRNKVSLQVVERIKSNFTNVNLDYLITGQKPLKTEITNVNSHKESSVSERDDLISSHVSDPMDSAIETSGSNSQTTIHNPKERLNSPTPDQGVQNTRFTKSEDDDGIDQIMVLYSDGSFKAYKERVN
jgi:transcriptional regulator with XRE-family HTH domain